MKSFFRMSYPYILWIGIFIVAPMIMILLYAITRTGNNTLTFQFTLDNFSRFFSDPDFIKVLLTSLRIALFTTVFCLLIGYPTAYFLASRDFSNAQTLVVLILVPMWMNFLLRTYAMMTLFENNGVINTLLESLGLERIQMIGTEGAVLVGMVYNFLPFMVLPVYTVLKKMDCSVIEAAEDLGASPIRVVSRVVLPMSIPGVVSGITMVFMPAVTTFAISRMLSSGMIYLVGDMIEDYFIAMNNRNVGSTISLVMLVLIILSIGLLRKVDPDNTGGGLW